MSTQNLIIRSLQVALFSLSLLFAAVPTAAEDQPKPVQPVKHRVTGLFSPDRQDDLRLLVQEKLPNIKLVSIDYENSEATFEYDADKLFDKPKPEQIIERFDNLLRTHSVSTFGIKPLCTIPKDKLTRIEIPVVGLDCKGCCLGAYDAISRVEGVERATASFKEGLVTAVIDPTKTNRMALEEALTKVGVQLAQKK
jgi:copper chaperone CopZ